MVLPHRIHIEAAIAALEAIPDEPNELSIVRQSYAKAMTLGRFGVRSMIEAETLLVELDLAESDGHRISRTDAGRAYVRLDLTTACEITAHKLLDRLAVPCSARPYTIRTYFSSTFQIRKPMPSNP